MIYKVNTDNFDRKKWERCAGEFADYTIYQTWPYQQVRGEIGGQKVSRFIVKDENGHVATMGQVRIKHVKILGLKIGYIQWGPLVRGNDGTLKCCVEILRALRTTYLGERVNVLRVVPNIYKGKLGNQLEFILESAGFTKNRNIAPYKTFIVSLIESEEEIFSRIYKEGRRLIRRAGEKGIDITNYTSDESFEILERMYHKAKQRKGFAGIHSGQMRRVQLALTDDEKMWIIIARINGNPVSAQAVSHFGDTAIPVVFANEPEGLKSGAAYLVWWRSYRMSRDLGMKYYDLGGIDPEKNPKGYLFKKRMGGEESLHIGAFEAYNSISSKIIWRSAYYIYQFFKNP